MKPNSRNWKKESVRMLMLLHWTLRAGPESHNESAELTFYHSTKLYNYGRVPTAYLMPHNCSVENWGGGDSPVMLLDFFI